MREFTTGVAVFVGLAAGSAGAGLVANGGFESGSFSGWTGHGNTGSMSVVGTYFAVAPYAGSYQAQFAQFGTAGGIQQTLSLAANTPVTVSFRLYNFGGDSVSLFRAEFGGSMLLSLFNAPAFGYTEYVFSNVMVNAANPLLKFTARQDSTRFLLDEVSVVRMVPLPGGAGMGLAGLGIVGLAGGVVRRRRGAAAAG